MSLKGIVVCFFVSRFVISETELLPDNIPNRVRKFPQGFIFGASTSAYQVEGAWDQYGKSESIWDRDVHQIPSPISDNSTGDIAADSYHLYKRDVEMLRELGVDFYRFSLAWPRILPTSFPDQINQEGVDYYNNLINELLKYNIQPVVTLFHWDLPTRLQNLGGWANPLIVDWYGDYVRIVFELFGDRVKYWITMNEPHQICGLGYGADFLAPRLNNSGIAEYFCLKYLYLGHATAYHIYDKEFRASQGGNIFISLSLMWYEAESEMYTAAADDTMQWGVEIFAYPIFSKNGDWPPPLKKKIARKSAEQGFITSRLPDFTPEQVEFLRGTSDFLGLNHYTSFIVNTNRTVLRKFPVPSWNDDMGTNIYQLKEWMIDEFAYLRYVPNGLFKLLSHLRVEYDNPPVFITENGYGNFNSRLEDDDRIMYYRGYLDAILDAIDEGSNVVGYAAWCLMDNFEWTFGYSVKFGLYHVDFSSPMRTRTPRKSAFVYKEIIRSRALDPYYLPPNDTYTGTG